MSSKNPDAERVPVRRALLSVSDKRGLAGLGRTLADAGVELVSTGGTARALREAGLTVMPVEKVTGFPEMMEGRVKTLHPRIFGGLLALPDRPDHAAAMAAHALPLFDLAVVNLYPFAEAAARAAPLPELLEEIDIGGPSLVRAAAKNCGRVAVVVDPGDYAEMSQAIADGGTTATQRHELALKAFRHTARYDALVAQVLTDRFGERGLPPSLHLTGDATPPLRYGENPHQQGAFYLDPLARGPTVASAKQLQGKQLSYNNLLDFDGALAIVADFDVPTAVVIKHVNPCGVASAATLAEAYRDALATDPMAAFGGLIGLNRDVDAATAIAIAESFKEGVIAPGFSDAAREILAAKSKMRLLATGALDGYAPSPQLRAISGGWLLQEPDRAALDEQALRVVTQRAPTDEEWEGLRFGWKLLKRVRSNAIIFTRGSRTVGIGAGQMSRVDAVRIAAFKSRPDARGTVMISDAFFPFRDGLDTAAEAGVTAVMQAGGSIRDGEVIAAADEHGMAMVMTGLRHFRH